MKTSNTIVIVSLVALAACGTVYASKKYTASKKELILMS